MSDSYLAYHFLVKPKEPGIEILIAELSAVGFESFAEGDEGITAYIQKQQHHDELLQDIYIFNNDEFEISYTIESIAQINWNDTWEKNFNPIVVDEQVGIRAPFHEPLQLKYEIIIEPKMSFGTGHHETTHLMIQQLSKLTLSDKDVLDMGCGTGILAIYAEMRGASKIDAIDIDLWSYENTLENCHRNQCKKVSAYQGDASLLPGKKYDIIAANINRNILLTDLKSYALCLESNGVLLLSGFYEQDIPVIDTEAAKNGLKLDLILERKKWVSLRYLKN